MAVYVWPFDLEPDFPLGVLDYRVHGDRDPMHWHDYLEIALVIDGQGTFRFGRRALDADPGDVFFIDSSQPHVALAAPGTSLQLLLVLFRPELIAGAGCRELDLGYLAPFRADPGGELPRVPGTSDLAAEVVPLVHRLRESWERHDPAERQLVDATLRLVLALVNRRPGACQARAVVRAGDRRQQIRPVLAYVDGHCRESITLEDVAEVVHVSPSRVRHVFKDVTGVSFKEYLTQVRVAEAKRLLLATDLPVAEIAGAVSYTNLYQFYKVFYRSCAMSPAEYRRYYAPAEGEPVTVPARRAATRDEAGDEAGMDVAVRDRTPTA